MSSAEDFSTKYPEPVAEAVVEDTENEGATESPESDKIQLTSETLAKRKASPFTSTMDVALATAFATEKNILDGTVRAHGVPTRHQKLAAWERIRDCVNAFSGDTNLKTVQQCKDRHRNLIQAVRFKRTSGFMEGPLPLPLTNQNQEMGEQMDTTHYQQHGPRDKTGDDCVVEHHVIAPDPANGTPSTSAPALSPITPREKRPLKRRPSSPTETTEEYRKRKLAILVKEHIVRVELMKAQTEYYKAKTELLMKHSCSRPMNLQTKLPSHLQPNVPGTT